jgi:TolB-like protein/Flp pilus assembly protein TadD
VRYLFEGHVLDTDRRELRRKGDVVPVTPQVLDLLAYLIGNRERIVSKDDLIAAIWGGRIVSETALTTRLYVARNAIGDTGESQQLIKTLPRKGFRFVGAVREEHGRASIPTPVSSCGSPRRGLPDRPSIVALPFTNMSGDPNLEFFGDGIAEDVLTELSKLRWPLLIARDPRFNANKSAVNVRQVGRELGVRYVLEGNVRSAGGRARVTGRLIDATTGVHTWSERYDLNWADVFALHDDVALAIASAIAPAIVHAERQRAQHKLPEDLGAWDSYLRGMWHMSKSDAAENRLAQSLFQHAIDLDPNFGPGYGALAWSYMAASSAFSELTIAESCALSEPLVRKAIALDETDTDARARLALTALLKGDLEGVIQEAEQVLSVKANCADALGVTGAALVYAGRRKEGREAIQRYFKLNPRDIARPIRLTQIASSLYIDGGYEEAARTAGQVVRQYPKHPIAYRWLAASLGQLGRAVEAQEVLHTLQTISPSSFEMYVRQRPPKYCSAEYAPMLEGLRKAGWKE